MQEIDFQYTEDRARCRLVYEGQHALSLTVPRGGEKTMPEREMVNYSWIEGVAHRNRATSGAEGFGVRFGGAELELGEGALADELRGLGLPGRPLMTTWMQRMYGTFGPTEKL